MKKCGSCGKEVLKGYIEFKCPSCGKGEIIRCSSCREIAVVYSCDKCGFSGP